MLPVHQLPFNTSHALNGAHLNEEAEGSTIRIDNEIVKQDITDLLRLKLSIHSPLFDKYRNNLFKICSMCVIYVLKSLMVIILSNRFNEQLTYSLEIQINYNNKTLHINYQLCRESGQGFFIESKAQRLLIQRGINKLNQSADIGIYSINTKGGIRFKQHIFIEHSTFDDIMEEYKQKQGLKFYGLHQQLHTINVGYSNKDNLTASKIAETKLIKLLDCNIEKHIKHLNINTAKILYLCDEIPREYFDILERQGGLESQKQLDTIENIFKEVDEITNSDKIYVEEITDTTAFQTPAQVVENGLKTKIVQQVEIIEIQDKSNIGSGGFGDIYKAEIKIKGATQDDQTTNRLKDQQIATPTQTTEKHTGSTTIPSSVSQNNSSYMNDSQTGSQKDSNNESATDNVVEEKGEASLKTYVLKENRDQKDNQGDRNRVQHEIDILMLLQDFECPYIAKYYFSKQAQFKQYLIIEFYRNKDLDTFRRNFSNTSSLISKIELMYQFSSGLKFLNDRGFYHLDIKPANILVSNKQQIKITDFGECYHHDVCEESYRCDWDPHFERANKNHLEKIGWKSPQKMNYNNNQQNNPPVKKTQFKPAKTMPYCPPESLSHKLQINYQSDIFSLGVMMCEIFFDEFPFKFKKSKYTNIEEKYKDKKWESFMPEEFACKQKGPEKIIRILIRLALRCLNSSLLKQEESAKNYKLDRPCISQIIIVLKKCKEYLEQRYVNAFNKT